MTDHPRCKSFIRLIIYVASVLGFCFQSLIICNDYFKYPTTTLVSLDFPDNVLLPKVGYSSYYPLKWGTTLKDHFRERFKSACIVGLGLRMTSQEVKKDKTLMRHRMFFRSTHFYDVFELYRPTRFASDGRYRSFQTDAPFYFYFLKIKPRYLPYRKESHPTFNNYFLASHNCDMENLLEQNLYISHQNALNKSEDSIHLTYTTKITKLAPPPYDTGCKDYSTIGYTSAENCLSECLTDFTSRFGMIIESNVISMEKYQNSSLVVIPYYFRTLKDGNDQITENILKTKVAQSNETSNFYKKLLHIFQPYKRHWKMCRELCKRPDCYTESSVGQLLVNFGYGNYSSQLIRVTIIVHPSYDQVTIVKSEVKLQFIDFIVYILSSLSFWFGFSPLTIMDGQLSSTVALKIQRHLARRKARSKWQLVRASIRTNQRRQP